MPDALLRRIIDPPSAALASRISRWSVSATGLLVIGFGSGIGAVACIAAHKPLAGLGFIALKQVLAGVAEPLARMTGGSPLAAFLGVVFDFLIRGSISLAFALADPSRALAAAFLILSFVGTGISLLAAAVFDPSAGMREEKSPLLPSGLIESATVYVAFALACVVPACFSAVAYGLGVACFVVAGTRVASTIERLK